MGRRTPRSGTPARARCSGRGPGRRSLARAKTHRGWVPGWAAAQTPNTHRSPCSPPPAGSGGQAVAPEGLENRRKDRPTALFGCPLSPPRTGRRQPGGEREGGHQPVRRALAVRQRGPEFMIHPRRGAPRSASRRDSARPGAAPGDHDNLACENRCKPPCTTEKRRLSLTLQARRQRAELNSQHSTRLFPGGLPLVREPEGLSFPNRGNAFGPRS
jgi:hypothetical protein